MPVPSPLVFPNLQTEISIYRNHNTYVDVPESVLGLDSLSLPTNFVSGEEDAEEVDGEYHLDVSPAMIPLDASRCVVNVCFRVKMDDKIVYGVYPKYILPLEVLVNWK